MKQRYLASCRSDWNVEKTTTLINIVKDRMSTGMAPDKIGFFFLVEKEQPQKLEIVLGLTYN